MTRGLRHGLWLAALTTLTCARTFGATGVNTGWLEVRSAHFVVSTNAGEKEARRIADQFEQIRTLFHSAFPTLRVDPAQPVLILAAKNENTMKMLLPEDWEVKGHVHPAGLYQQGEDKHYVILQLDSGGTNPFHALYHEYTHALMHLNFSGLPLWLDEGIAEFYGNSKLDEKESRIGTIDESHLYILSQNKLLPIETLLNVEQSSPYYNEANQASVFYAESWALMHYLMLDPEAQKQQLLKNFLVDWDQSGSQIEAAKEAFGDLRAFGKVIEGYSRQRSFRVALYKSKEQAADKDYAVRSLTPGEVLALRGDCAAHRNKFDLAQPLLERAVRDEPNLAFGHEAIGFYLYRKEERVAADKEMKAAIELGSTSFVPLYYHGLLLLRGGLGGSEAAQEAIKSFQKVTTINARFAPAFEGLAQAYSLSAETQKLAVEAGIQAVRLEPAEHTYAVNLVYLLLNNDRPAEAKQLAKRLLEKAASAEEKNTARELLNRIEEREQWVERMKAQPTVAANPTGQTVAVSTTGETAPTPARKTATTTSTRTSVDVRTLMAVEGAVGRIDCSHKPAVTVVVSGGNRPLIFYAADFGAVGVTGKGKDVPGLDACEKWNGRRIRLWFRAVKGKDYLGEITDIAFQ
jgi:Flp pilus assembly protein TadD